MHFVPRLGKLSLALGSLFATMFSHQTAVFGADAAPATDTITSIEVTAGHLKSARIGLSPKVGTTIYSVDSHMIEMLGQGENTPFNEVLLRLPGIAQDSKASGSLHVRDDHGNVQYRINGVQLPESITGFGQSIDTRQIDQTDFITGALPIGLK